MAETLLRNLGLRTVSILKDRLKAELSKSNISVTTGATTSNKIPK
jgi:hypothetical protein